MHPAQELDHSNVLVVIPAYNEQHTISDVVAGLISLGFSTLVINDSSSDATSTFARQAGAIVLDLPFNMGVGGALRTGFKYAIRQGFEAVVQVDGDGQHPATEVMKLIEAANKSSADFVLGSRFLENLDSMVVAPGRRLVMRILAKIASNACQIRITDSTSGLRLIRGDLLKELSTKLPSNYLGDTFEALVATGHAGYRVLEIPVQIVERKNGASSASKLAAVSFTIKGLAVALLRVHTRMAGRNSP